MKDLIALTRMMNLYYHHLHNIASGVSFSGDHELMAGFYDQLEVSYDSLIERYMGLGNTCEKSELIYIIEQAHEVLEQIPEGSDIETHFKYAIGLEKYLRSEIESEAKSSSLGTENLLATLADESEQRTYKLEQRIK